MTEREELARIIDPGAFELDIQGVPHPDDMAMYAILKRQQDDAFAKADQILSRPSPVDGLKASLDEATSATMMAEMRADKLMAEVERLKGATSMSLLDRLSEAEAEVERLKSDVDDLVRAGSDEATENARLREALDTTDYNKLGKIGQAALDVCLPILKSHWAGSVSASMNPSLDYLDVRMGQAAIKAIKTLTGDLTNG